MNEPCLGGAGHYHSTNYIRCVWLGGEHSNGACNGAIGAFLFEDANTNTNTQLQIQKIQIQKNANTKIQNINVSGWAVNTPTEHVTEQ